MLLALRVDLLNPNFGGVRILGVPYWGPFYKGSDYLGVYIGGPRSLSQTPHFSARSELKLRWFEMFSGVDSAKVADGKDPIRNRNMPSEPPEVA